MKKIIPTQDYVVLEIQRVKTNIVLPDDVVTEKSCLIVLDVGPDVKKIRKGDSVITTPFDYIKVKFDDEDKKEYYMAREEFIIGVIKEKK